MEMRKLGNSDLPITRVGYGAWAIGAQAGSSPGDRRTTTNLSPPFTARSNSASTGSTPPPSTVWDTPRKWLAVL